MSAYGNSRNSPDQEAAPNLTINFVQRGYATAVLLASCLALWRLCAIAAEGYQAFALFDPKVEIDIEDGEIDVTAQFTLASGSNGIDIAAEPLHLHVTGGGRSYAVTIPAGSFKTAKNGRSAYVGTIERVKIIAELRTLRTNAYELELETEGANLNGFANPVTVNLIIGDDGGSRSVRAKIE